MTTNPLLEHFQTILDQLATHCQVADSVLDLDAYRVQIALFWIQVVVSPDDVQATEEDIEDLYLCTNQAIAKLLGANESLNSIFKLLQSTKGEALMERLKVANYQKDLLDYFATLMINPEEHKKRMAAARQQAQHPKTQH